MFKTKVSLCNSQLMRKTLTGLTSSRNQNIQLPCSTHPNYQISHVCLALTCSQNISFCSECLFDQQQQQHIAKHKQNLIGWTDFIQLCRRMSVQGRMGDIFGENPKNKEMVSLLLQTSTHQQQFKTYMRQQEQAINNDFDKMIEKFTQDVNKIKTDLNKQYKLYLQELVELGVVVEKMVKELSQNKGESKEYSNDFDNFLKEIQIIQEQIHLQETKFVRQSLQTLNQNNVATPVQFNLKRLMQNIIPLVSRAQSNFEKNLQKEGGIEFQENQSVVSGLSLFSSFQNQNPESSALNDIVNEYKKLLENKPVYKNQGVALQIYNQAQEQLSLIYHKLSDNLQNFIVPQFKGMLATLKINNKENNIELSIQKQSKVQNLSQRAQIRDQTLSPTRKLFADKSTIIIDTIIKQQQTNNLKTLQAQNQDTIVDDEGYKELFTKQNQVKQINAGQVQIATEEETIPDLVGLDFKGCVSTPHKGGINCMLLVDEDYIATGSNDKTLKVFKTSNYELYKEVQFKSDVTTLCSLSRPDASSMVVAGIYRAICLLNQSFEVVKIFDSQPSFIDKASSLSTQTPKVTLNLNDNFTQMTAQSPSRNQQIAQQIVHNGQINQIVAISDGQTVISCSQGDNKIVQWNLIENNQQLPKKYFEHRDSVTCLCLLNGDTQVASAGKDRNIRIFNQVFYDKEFKNGSLEKLQLSLSINDAHQTEITCLNSTPTQSLILSMSSTGELKMWDSQDGQLLRTVKNYAGWGYKIVFLYQICTQQNKRQRITGSPSRRYAQKQNECLNNLKKGYLITFSFDGTIKVYDSEQFLTDNQSGNYQPKISIQTKSLLDCHPFGGVLVVQDSNTQKLQVLTTGNKNDNNIQIYNFKEI